ncbi:MAG: type III-B CRISPR module RAMP protein Cmr4 [Promethearchaeota archaeon]
MITPLHAGTGRGLGYIDLPVKRERVTGWPYIAGSTMKGIIKANLVKSHGSTDWFVAAFGSETATGEMGSAGSMNFTNARILCIPVRSVAGTFSYATCPLILQTLLRDLHSFNIASARSLPDPFNFSPAECESIALDSSVNALMLEKSKKIVLEDIDFKVLDRLDDSQSRVEPWATWIADLVFPDNDDDEKEFFKKRFVIIPDDQFDFFCQNALQVDAHIRIDMETMIVKDGALWYEECLPPETILINFSWCGDVHGEKVHGIHDPDELLDNIAAVGKKFPIFMGGKSTAGKGLVRLLTSKGGVH